MQTTRWHWGAALAAVVVSAAACRDTDTAYEHQVRVCGDPPANTASDLTHEAKVQIQEFVEGGSAAGNRRQVTQVLNQQGLACDALLYRACQNAVAFGADQEMAMDMHRLAMHSSACKGHQGPPTDEPETPVEPPPAPGPTASVAPPAPGGPAAPEWRPGHYMGQALSHLMETAVRVQAQTEYGFDGAGTCVMGTYLEGGTNIRMSRPFEANVSYAIVGGGDEDATDVDIAVLTSDGQLVKKDIETDNKPLVEFVPPADGNYQIVLSLPSQTGSFAAVAIMRKGGYNVPVKNLGESFGSTLRTAAAYSRRTGEAQGLAGLKFHAGGDWSLYSVVMNKGESIGFSGLDLDGTHVVLAGSDGVARDIDLEVKDASGNVAGRDVEKDNQPVVVVNASPGSYSVRMEVHEAGAPSLVTVLVLTAEKG